MLSDREGIRNAFFEAWARHQAGLPTDPSQARIVKILVQHPEYHGFFSDAERHRDRDWHPQGGVENPFLHLGLHIALDEQITLGLPVGVRGHYERLTARLGDGHAAAHRLMECLAEVLWTAERDRRTPDETAYQRCLAELT